MSDYLELHTKKQSGTEKDFPHHGRNILSPQTGSRNIRFQNKYYLNRTPKSDPWNICFRVPLQYTSLPLFAATSFPVTEKYSGPAAWWSYFHPASLHHFVPSPLLHGAMHGNQFHDAWKTFYLRYWQWQSLHPPASPQWKRNRNLFPLSGWRSRFHPMHRQCWSDLP